jgi:hypothetical protein
MEQIVENQSIKAKSFVPTDENLFMLADMLFQSLQTIEFFEHSRGCRCPGLGREHFADELNRIRKAMGEEFVEAARAFALDGFNPAKDPALWNDFQQKRDGSAGVVSAAPAANAPKAEREGREVPGHEISRSRCGPHARNRGQQRALTRATRRR